MQHFRRITTLQEDFAKIGLSAETLGVPQRPSRVRPLVEDDQGDTPDDDATGDDEGEQTVEGLQRVKVKKMKSADKAKARMASRKGKAKRNRQRRMNSKKAGYKRRMTKLAKMKKGKSAGGRMRFKLVQGMERAANVLESLDVRRLVESTNPAKQRRQLAEALVKVAGLAGALGRRYAVLESALLDEEASLGLDVMHAGSAYGWDDANSTSFAGGSAPKTGEATDYAGKAKTEDDADPIDGPAPEAMPGSDEGETDEGVHVGNPSTEDDEDPLDAPEDEGDEFDDADLGDDDLDLGDEDETDEAYENRRGPKGKPITERSAVRRTGRRPTTEALDLPMDHELAAIRVEATEVALNLQQGNVSMGQASNIMGDMVSYLGGAMKLYNQLVGYLGELGYVGQDTPPQAGGEAAIPSTDVGAVTLGAGMPDGKTAISTPTPAGGAKTGDAIDGSSKTGAEPAEESRRTRRSLRPLKEAKTHSITVYKKTLRWPDEEADEPDEVDSDEETFDAEPDDHEIENGETPASLAAEYISNQSSNLEASSGPGFHKGMWYSDHSSQNTDGTFEEMSFHPEGFTPDEERELYDLLKKQWRF